MSNFLEYAKFDTGNGPGVRSSVFFAGCSLKCKGCWNPESWNPRNGENFTKFHEDQVIEGLSHSAVRGLSLLGGEPFENLEAALPLARRFRETFGNSKDLWVWSGRLYGNLLLDERTRELLVLCDVLVDGPFRIDQRDLSLKYRGSRNQRVLDVQKSFGKGSEILFEKL